MNRSELSAERARELFSYDPATGLLTWRVNKGRARAGSRAGTPNEEGYLRVEAEGSKYHVHRLAWLITTGSWPKGLIDHRNGVRSDNRWGNIREATRSTNAENQRQAKANSITGFLGVYPERGRFRAQIKALGTVRHLGYYRTPEEAHQAYLTAKRQLHSGCMI